MNKLKLSPDKLLLLLIFITFSASTIFWTVADKTPPAWDPADHISAGYDYYAPLARLDFKEFYREFFIYPHYYAPFVHLCTAVIMLIFGASRVTGIGVNLLSLGVLLYTVNWLCRYLFKDDSNPDEKNRLAMLMGVLASLLAASYHFSAWLIHDGFLDYPLMVIITVSFALLLKAGNFQNRKAALWFGLAAGLGMLTKQTFAFFFALPAIYVSLKILWSRDFKAITNLMLAGLVIVAIASIWYAPHLAEVIAIYRENQTAAVHENEAPLFSMMSNLFYLHGLLSPQIQVPFALLFLFGLGYSLIRHRRESVIPALWILSGIGMFTLVANKDLRYTFPVLPAVAILSVSWVKDLRLDLKNKSVFALKLAPVAVIAGWAVVSFFNAQYPGEGMGRYLDTPRFRWMVYGRNYYGFDHRPLNEDWGIPEAIQNIEADWQARPARSPHPENSNPATPQETLSPSTHKVVDSGNTPTVGVVVNLPFLNPSNVALYVRLMTKGRGAPALFKVEWLTAESSKERFADCDYLIMRTGLDEADWLAPLERHAEQLVKQTPGTYQRIAALPIPLKNAESVVYRKIQ
ncbi:MAG: hypothetical protein AB1757_14640 [Acidobacteriota bacterium]